MSIVRSPEFDPTRPDPLPLPLGSFQARTAMCDALLSLDRARDRLLAFAEATGCRHAKREAEVLAASLRRDEADLRSRIAMHQGVRDIAPLLAPSLMPGQGRG